MPFDDSKNIFNISQHFRYDESSDTVIFTVPHNFLVKVDKHVIINSGKSTDFSLNIPHSVFLNTEVDDNNKPILEKKPYVPYGKRKPNIYKNKNCICHRCK